MSKIWQGLTIKYAVVHYGKDKFGHSFNSIIGETLDRAKANSISNELNKLAGEHRIDDANYGSTTNGTGNFGVTSFPIISDLRDAEQSINDVLVTTHHSIFENKN